jgi:hypothetical protein
MDKEESFDECDVPDMIEEEEKPKKEKSIEDELFEDEDEHEKEEKKKCKKKDEFDELYEQAQGNSEEDIYATDEFERYDPGVSD